MPLFVAVLAMWGAGCGGAVSDKRIRAGEKDLLEKVNAARHKEELEPLVIDPMVSGAARQRADAAASSGAIEVDDNRLPKLVAAGSFARFALTHAVKAESVGEALQKLENDEIARSKVLHGRLTALGLGLARGPAGVFAVMDLARVVPEVDLAAARDALLLKINSRREANGTAPLEMDEGLAAQAGKIAGDFMASGGSSDELIAATQSELGGDNFALGRVTITFQVAGDLEAVVIPSMISDPALDTVGLGLAQGNHPDHEAGSIAVALLVAAPQTAHDAARSVSDLPAPKAVPTRKQARKQGSPVERAWIATLSGSHRRAAKLFKQAYKKGKDPKMLYEAARAHARDGNAKKALVEMKKYTALVEGEEKLAALDLVARLELGETIFSTSEEEKMSTETKRFFVIGQRLFDQGEWDGAIDAFQQAYTYSKHPDIIYNIGLTHCRAGRVGEALRFFDEYQRHVPKAESVEQARQLFDIGLELYKAGQFEAASRHFAMTYAFMAFPELVYNLALCHKAMGENDEAVRFLREFLDTDPPARDRAEVEKMIEELSSQAPVQ